MRLAGGPADLRGTRAGELPRGGGLIGRPHEVGEQPSAPALSPLGREQLGDVRDERGRQLEISLLVRAAIAEHDPLGGARDRRVEQVALALQRVLPRPQPEPAAHGELAPALVVEERLGADSPGKLVLLKPAHEHHSETARADRKRLA